jgi:hypothetical protein
MCSSAAIMPQQLSLAVVGAIHSNPDGSNRLFEIAMLRPGEPVALRPEPTNKVDPSAVAVLSPRGIQIGYLSAERCGWIGARIRQGRDIVAIFQEKTKTGAVIRVHLDGGTPTLPSPRNAVKAPPAERWIDPDDGFWPDYIPPDE